MSPILIFHDLVKKLKLKIGCMQRLLLLGLFVSFSFSGIAQSKSVEKFRNTHQPNLKLFFYESTLKMISRIDVVALSGSTGLDSDLGQMPPITEMITGIEKVKFFMYDEPAKNDAELFQQLQKDVEDEGYESIASARVEGNIMNLLMKERRGDPEGFVVIVTMEDGYSIIDIEGFPDLNNVLKFSQFLNENSSKLRFQDFDD